MMDFEVFDYLDTQLISFVPGSLSVDGNTITYGYVNGRVTVHFAQLLPDETAEIRLHK